MIQWEFAKKEICHIRDSVEGLLQTKKVSPAENIVMYDIMLDPSSSIGSFLQLELEINQEMYLRFLIVILIKEHAELA
jgi:hypothetical protein